MTLDEILTAARNLPDSERAQLIHALWDSIPPDEWVAPDDDVVAEVQRRSKAIDENRMETSPWPEVRRRARRQAGLDE